MCHQSKGETPVGVVLSVGVLSGTMALHYCELADPRAVAMIGHLLAGLLSLRRQICEAATTTETLKHSTLPTER